MWMTNLLRRLTAAFSAINERLARLRLPLGAAVSAALAAGFALMSVYAGPIYNLNDIGGFGNRAVFIVMAAAVYFALLLLTAALCRGGVWRMLLRQMIVTAGMMILLTGINQKTYFYVDVTQPLVRAMDASGLGAYADFGGNLSAPAAALVYLITRGPVYDMYSVKLVCIAAYLLLGLLALYAADRAGLGMRAEALLALCMILPQGFMSAGCSALMDGVCAALLAVSLALLAGKENSPAVRRACAALYGLALAMSGFALYALPAYAYAAHKGRISAKELAAAFALPVLLCVPAIASGVPVGQAVSSLLRANLGLGEYASGAPGMFSLVPRAQVTEMPIIWWMNNLPAIDAATNAQPYYTQQHFEIASLGFAFAGAAMYAGVAAWLWQKKEMKPLVRVFALVLTALMVCPGATNGAWLLAGVLSLYAVFAERSLRLPACMVLFSVCCSAVYPMTEEVLLPMAAAFALNLCALLIALEMIPDPFRAED